MDDETLQFYRQNAEAYAGWAKAPSTRLTGFLAMLPPGGSILELGCGAGNHAAKMLAAGFKVHATDGSPEMAEIASQHLGHPVQPMLFHELDARAAYRWRLGQRLSAACTAETNSRASSLRFIAR